MSDRPNSPEPFDKTGQGAAAAVAAVPGPIQAWPKDDQIAHGKLPAIAAQVRAAAASLRSTPTSELEPEELGCIAPLAAIADGVAGYGDWAVSLLGMPTLPKASPPAPQGVRVCEKALDDALQQLEALHKDSMSVPAAGVLRTMIHDLSSLQHRIADSAGRGN